jgi:hypothetical protein
MSCSRIYDEPVSFSSPFKGILFSKTEVTMPELVESRFSARANCEREEQELARLKEVEGFIQLRATDLIFAQIGLQIIRG